MRLRMLLISVALLAVTVGRPCAANAVQLNCPSVVVIKAGDAPFPWTAISRTDAVLRFAEASYSCSNGTCTLSCGYATPTSVYNLLNYKVPPGTCHYTNEGRSFSCSSLPPPRHH